MGLCGFRLEAWARVFSEECIPQERSKVVAAQDKGASFVSEELIVAARSLCSGDLAHLVAVASGRAGA